MNVSQKIVLLLVLVGFCYTCVHSQPVVSRRTAAAAVSIALDDTSKGQQTSGETLTVAHTCTGAGILWVGVASWLDGGGQTMTATYNGDAMTQFEAQAGGTGNALHVFYRLNPDAGTNNIVIEPSDAGAELALAGMSLKNSDAVSGNLDTTDEGTAWSLTPNSATGSWAVSFITTYNKTVSVTNGTFRVMNNQGATQASVYCITRDGAATVQINGTLSGSEFWIQIAGSSDP